MDLDLVMYTKKLMPAECLHGGDDRGETHYGMTVFPQPVGLAAAFDRSMLHDIASIISDEMRAVSNLYRNTDGSARYALLPVLKMQIFKT